MTSTYEVQVKLTSAKDLKNVNWRHGPVKPYAVAWVDPANKFTAKVDESGDTSPEWDETLTIPIPGHVKDDTILYIDIVHAGSEPDIKKLVGSAQLRLRDVVDAVGYDERASRTLPLKRPSGRPQGKVEVKVTVREPRYRAPEPYYAPPYGVPPANSGYYHAPPPPPAYGHPYAAPAPPPVYGGMYASQDSGYPYNAGQAAYGQPAQASYGQVQYGEEGKKKKKKKKSKFGGMGTGLAVGAVAGLLGAFALAEGVDYVEDKIADDVAEKVVDNLSYYDDEF